MAHERKLWSVVLLALSPLGCSSEHPFADEFAQANGNHEVLPAEQGRAAARPQGRAAVTPAANDLGNVMAAVAMLMVKCTGTIGPDSFVLDGDGYLKLPDDFKCTRDEPSGRRLDGEIKAFLSLQYPRPESEPGVPESRLVIPNAKENIAGRWGAWKSEFVKTGMTQAECPVWTETRTYRTSTEEQLAELADTGMLASAETDDASPSPMQLARPVNRELFQSISDFEVSFGGKAVSHSCAEGGPGGCAAKCAGAFPGFVLATKGSTVTTDPMEWLSGDIYEVNFNPYLSPGYYHPMAMYGEVFAHRARANNCGATSQLYAQCNIEVQGNGPAAHQRRACSYKTSSTPADNCPSELGSVWVNPTTFRLVRLRLNCLGDIQAQTPGTPEWQEVWDTCVSHLYLPP